MDWYNGFSPAQRARAGRWISREVKAGRLSWPSSCMICGRTDGRFQLHAEDYGEPFGPQTSQFGVCARCHQQIHRRFTDPVRYAAYADVVERGALPGADPTLLLRIEAGEFVPDRPRPRISEA
jgi:hypothetical protein